TAFLRVMVGLGAHRRDNVRRAAAYPGMGRFPQPAPESIVGAARALSHASGLGPPGGRAAAAEVAERGVICGCLQLQQLPAVAGGYGRALVGLETVTVATATRAHRRRRTARPECR